MRTIKTMYKCFACEKLTDHIAVKHDYQDGDPLMCPLCGAVEPGFAALYAMQWIIRNEWMFFGKPWVEVECPSCKYREIVPKNDVNTKCYVCEVDLYV